MSDDARAHDKDKGVTEGDMEVELEVPIIVTEETPAQDSQDVDDSKSDEATLEELHAMVCAEDMHFISALCSVLDPSEFGTVAKSIISLLSTRQTQTLICQMIDREVADTEQASTLFRTNSVATKLMTAFSKAIGLPYLRTLLNDILEDICVDQTCYEVDPAKVEKQGLETDVQANLVHLRDTAVDVITRVLHSVESVPVPLRVLCAHLRNAVAGKFPQQWRIPVCGFFFLRYLCPAIVAPEGYNVIENRPTPNSRRVLVLVAKTLQNLANGVHFGDKESYLDDLNSFIEEYLQPLDGFFEQLTDTSDMDDATHHDNEGGDPQAQAQQAQQAQQTQLGDELTPQQTADLLKVHKQLVRCQDKILDLLNARGVGGGELSARVLAQADAEYAQEHESTRALSVAFKGGSVLVEEEEADDPRVRKAQNVLMEGWVHKRAGSKGAFFSKAWKRVYARLFPDMLCYYKSQGMDINSYMGAINLTQGLVLRTLSADESETGYGFILEALDETAYVAPSSQQDTDAWLAKVEQLIAQMDAGRTSDVDESLIVKQGYLGKKGSELASKLFKRRYFILTKLGQLRYYESKGSVHEPLRVISLLGKEARVRISGKIEFAFDVWAPGEQRWYVLQAEDVFEMDEWVEALDSLLDTLDEEGAEARRARVGTINDEAMVPLDHKTRSGYMYKQGQDLLKTMKRRYFVLLSDGRFLYFKNPQIRDRSTEPPIGDIPLNSASVLVSEEAGDSDNTTLEVFSPMKGRLFRLKCDTEENMYEWMADLQRASILLPEVSQVLEHTSMQAGNGAMYDAGNTRRSSRMSSGAPLASGSGKLSPGGLGVAGVAGGSSSSSGTSLGKRARSLSRFGSQRAEPPPDISSKMRSGYLYKQGNDLRKAWKKRYVILLRSGRMFYFKNPQSGSRATEPPQGEIDLAYAKLVLGENASEASTGASAYADQTLERMQNMDLADANLEFEIFTPEKGRNYRMRAETKHELDLWLADIQAQITMVSKKATRKSQYVDGQELELLRMGISPQARRTASNLSKGMLSGIMESVNEEEEEEEASSAAGESMQGDGAQGEADGSSSNSSSNSNSTTEGTGKQSSGEGQVGSSSSSSGGSGASGGNSSSDGGKGEAKASSSSSSSSSSSTGKMATMAMEDMAPHKVVHEGYLGKQGADMLKKFKIRYFVLYDDGLVQWYKSPSPEDMKEVIGRMVIRGDGTAAQVTGKESKKRFSVISQVAGSRKYILRADTNQDRVEWMRLINDVAKACEYLPLPAFAEGEDESGTPLSGKFARSFRGK